MTPNSIRTGRGFDSRTTSVAVGNGDTVTIAAADSARVAAAIAAPGNAFAAALLGITIGEKVAGVVVPLTTLLPGHPACYLSVDKIGTAVMGELFAVNLTGGAVTLGVTLVRQIQPLGAE